MVKCQQMTEIKDYECERYRCTPFSGDENQPLRFKREKGTEGKLQGLSLVSCGVADCPIKRALGKCVKTKLANLAGPYGFEP